MHGCMAELWKYGETSGERNYIEQINVPTYLEAVFIIEVI